MQPQTSHKKVLSIALPAAANALLDMLQVIVDLLMVGKISTFAIAAVGLGLQIFMLFYFFFGLFHIGTTAVISRFIGAGEMKRASLALSSMIRFGLWASIPVVIVWSVFAPQVYLWFGVALEVIDFGFDYVMVLTIMLPFIIFKIIFVSAFNAYGDTKTPLYIQIFSIALNIILNYLLIFGYGIIPAMGVMGAAIATVIVNILATLIYLALYIHHKSPYRPLWKYSKGLVKKMVKIGLPTSIEQSLSMGSYMIFSYIIASYGTYAFAGYQLGLRIEGIAFTSGIGFTIAAMTLVGQALGAKNPAQAKHDVIVVLRYTIGLMGVLSIFMVSMPESIISLFTDDAQTIAQASIYLIIVGLSQIPLAFDFVLNGALRGAGDTRTTLKINLLSLWFVRIIPAFVLSYYFNDIIFVYLAMISDTTLKAIALWIVFNQGKWQKIKL
ncbi:MAG: MATE family efflux transporter [Campylobacterales bacterium]|nr:MATE family efflux transporter [Campylobacterales bacterium]